MRSILIVSWVIFRLDFRISEWISGFQSGFLDFRLDFWISEWISGFQLDFWISDWISGFQIGFLPTVYEISFVADPSTPNQACSNLVPPPPDRTVP